MSSSEHLQKNLLNARSRLRYLNKNTVNIDNWHLPNVEQANSLIY